MMAADYRHIGGHENRLGRHYSRFSPFWPARPLQVNHLPCENCATLDRIGEVGLSAGDYSSPRLHWTTFDLWLMLAGSAQAQSLSQLTGTRVNPYREGENSGITQFPGLVDVV